MAILDFQTKHFIEDIPRIMFAKFPQMVESVQKKVRKKCKTDEHKAMTITNTKLFWSSQYENKNSLQLLLMWHHYTKILQEKLGEECDGQCHTIITPKILLRKVRKEWIGQITQFYKTILWFSYNNHSYKVCLK